MLYSLVLFATLCGVSFSDMYLHYPRGSNNRLNEASANRDNANRICDTQNNNRGGYNVGDIDPTNGFDENTWMGTFEQMYNHEFLNADSNERVQYEMLYFEDSILSTTWTNQHGTGNQKLNSMVVLQFICDTFPRASSAGNDGSPGVTGTISSSTFSGTRKWWTSDSSSNDNAGYDDVATKLRYHGLRVELYNGGNTNTPDAPNSLENDANGDTISSEYSDNNSNNKGRRESEEYYAYCQSRYQQYGLFHADQDLQGDAQIYTRQNPGGTRRGLECPEERDYFPWWNPSPFHDIAIITPDLEWCEDQIAPESQNVKLKYQCVKSGVGTSTTLANWVPSAEAAAANLNQTKCESLSGHMWEGVRWNAQEPECVEPYWSKVNYLGNVDRTKRGGKQAGYDWTIPSYSSLVNDHYCYPYSTQIDPASNDDSVAQDYTVTVHCARLSFRIRYNMSTMDYDPYKTSSEMDEDDDEGIISPVENNPTVDVGVYAQGLRLALNTAQTGRVFQDFSHTFLVCERPTDAAWEEMNVLNVGVRGKRGNIVQTFPATEYDFEPQHIEIGRGDCLHFQWTGSNTHNNGAPGGDGQTGDAGEGRGGSDRTNLVQSKKMDESYPVTYDVYPFASSSQSDDDLLYNFFDYATCYHPLYANIDVSDQDAQLVLGSGGFYKGVDYASSQITNNGDAGVLDKLMNNVSASFRQGLVCCIEGDINVSNNGRKSFSFISTRNNNFTNRSQKLKIVLTNDPDDTTTW